MHPRRPRFAPARGGALGVFAVLALAVACETQLPTSAEVKKMDVASMDRAAVRARMITSLDSVVYTIDGARASAAQAHALSPDQIARINVVKAALDSAAVRRRAEIQITTKKAAERLSATSGAKPVSGEIRIDGPVRIDAPLSGGGEAKKPFTGLLLVDGVQADNTVLQTLSPDKIKSVEVIKGPAATKLYSDPKAANGVIRITTVDGSKSQ